jgi:hypothetical protein
VTLREWPGGAADLLGRFARSFDTQDIRGFPPEAIGGEKRRSLKLRELF